MGRIRNGCMDVAIDNDSYSVLSAKETRLGLFLLHL